MKLSAVDHSPSFALLGPGYASAPWTWIDDLSTATDDCARLFFARYETPGADAEGYVGTVHSLSHLEMDIAPQTLAPVLDARVHRQSVDAIRQSIAAGDVYQVNYTVRAALPPVDGPSLVASLCRRGIPSYFAWVRLPDNTEFVSASPEMFFKIADGRIHVQPMKGTAPAGCAEQLLASAKDAAELAMITDLLRNDITPLCLPRTVTVTHPRRLIHLPYAIQAVSDVGGTILPHIHWRDVLTALHPCGSVTGAPRRAAIAMISALEATPRGPYTGALGFVSDHTVTASVLIRTATRCTTSWVYGVGGGIVWDSDPDAELAEVHTKLGALG